MTEAETFGHVRAHPRASLYLAAVLRWDGHESVVRIRNLSVAGAMVEGERIPPAGTTIELLRGSLRASGTTAWARERRGGLHLPQQLSVEQWMAPGANRAQAQVDGLVAAVRTGSAPRPALVSTTPAPGTELGLLRRLLERLGDDLANDAAIVERHFLRLQDLDLAVQLVETLMRAAGEVDANRRLSDLRQAAARALHN